MRLYTETHQHYCGIDLHARTMYVCIVDREGPVLLHRNLPCDPERLLRIIAPCREDLVVAVACIYNGNEVRGRRDRGALAPSFTGADQTERTRDVCLLTDGGLIIGVRFDKGELQGTGAPPG